MPDTDSNSFQTETYVATTDQTWTVLKMLEWTTGWLTEQGIDSARLDAECMLAHVLGIQRIHLYVQFDRPLDDDELAAFKALIKRRAAGEPVAYLTGTRGFWTIDLKCDSRALIPRPETEIVVEEALELLDPDAEARILDVGTGTGVIGLTLANERPGCRVTLTELSSGALALAHENTEALELTERVELSEGDLFENVDGTFDLIVSNPPYVGTSERDDVDDAVHAFEPHEALYAGEDGLDVIRRLIESAPDHLEPEGWLIFEHGYRQGDAIAQLLEAAGYREIRIRKDYARHDRVAVAKRP